MPSIDKTNDALYDFLHADATLLALAPGDVWNQVADETAALPYVVFQRVTAVPDYTGGQTLSSERAVYMIKAYAVDTATKSGQRLVAQIVDRLKTILRDAALAITGSTTLACYPTHDIPPLIEPGSQGASKSTFSGGFYLDIVAA